LNSLWDSGVAALRLIAEADPLLASIVWRSLSLSATASAIAIVIGTFLGAWLAVSRFAGRGLVLAMLNTLLSLPSVVVGLVVYLLLSRSGPFGFLGYSGHGEQLRSLGTGPRLIGMLLAWDERSALLTVALAAFGRAIAEVGAVMLVGGNMDGFTRVMTTSIALETSKGDLPLAMGLGLVLLGVVLVLQLLLAGIRAWLQAVDAKGAAP
jgi:tungstate transport system permease protein